MTWGLRRQVDARNQVTYPLRSLHIRGLLTGHARREIGGSPRSHRVRFLRMSPVVVSPLQPTPSHPSVRPTCGSSSMSCYLACCRRPRALVGGPLGQITDLSTDMGPSSAWSARCWPTCTTNGKSPTAATSQKPAWPSSTKPAILNSSPPSRPATDVENPLESPPPSGALFRACRHCSWSRVRSTMIVNARSVPILDGR
jgi:hypothetical protein